MSAAAAGMIIALLAAGDPTPRTQTAKQLVPAGKHQIEQLIAGLGSDSYATREASTDALAAIGEDAVPFIERGLSNPDLEVQRRSELVLALIRWDVSPELRRVIGNLMVGFEKRNHTEREIIVRALASAEKKHAVRPLARIVTIEKHRGVWLSAVWALFDMGPEGELALAQAAVYLATAPKSNSVYTAYDRAMDAVKTTGSLPVPLHIRNAPTRLMKVLGYGKNYKYPHDYEAGVVFQEYLPEKLQGQHYYFPTDRGFEKTIKQRLEKWRSLVRKKRFEG